MATTHSKLDEIVESFSTIEDPRSHINRRHPLPSVLVVAVLAVLASSMAITSAICTSYITEIFAGTHLSGDTYKIALYTSAAVLDNTVTAYSATNEVSGTGYTAGGVALSGFTTGSSGKTGWIDWTTDPSWASATITARGALIYNSTRSNKAVAVIDFGADKTSTNGTFTVQLPAADASNAIVRFTGP